MKNLKVLNIMQVKYWIDIIITSSSFFRNKFNLFILEKLMKKQ